MDKDPCSRKTNIIASCYLPDRESLQNHAFLIGKVHPFPDICLKFNIRSFRIGNRHSIYAFRDLQDLGSQYHYVQYDPIQYFEIGDRSPNSDYNPLHIASTSTNQTNASSDCSYKMKWQDKRIYSDTLKESIMSQHTTNKIENAQLFLKNALCKRQ